VMRECGSDPDAVRPRALIVVLWRAGLRIGEALALIESDLDARRGAILVRHGKGDKRREVGMDSWAWDQLQSWRELRTTFPVGTYFCVIHGPTAGRNWEPSFARRQLAHTAAAAGIRRRFAPHQLRHAHAVEMAREGVPLVIIQRQLGHANLGVTSIYLQGIDNSEIIDTVHARRPPVIPAAAGLSTTGATIPAPRSTPQRAVRSPAARRRNPTRTKPIPPPSPPAMPTHLHG
jgi:site-specific recombinase XerD